MEEGVICHLNGLSSVKRLTLPLTTCEQHWRYAPIIGVEYVTTREQLL